MRVITLLTDFGMKDSYVGVMKGVILRINPEATVIDLCHEVAPQDILGAAFILKSSYRYFSDGTIHVVVVDPGVGSGRRVVCLRTSRYFFLAPDNGVLTLILQNEKIGEMVEVANGKYFLGEVSQTFHGRDIFAPVAAHLSKGVNLTELGPRISQAPLDSKHLKGQIKQVEIPRVNLRDDGNIEGEVIYIDRFGNLITNIARSDWEELKEKFPHYAVRILVGGKEISRVNKSYAETEPGELLAIFGSSNNLEISLSQGNAHQALGIGLGGKVVVEML